MSKYSSNSIKIEYKYYMFKSNKEKNKITLIGPLNIFAGILVVGVHFVFSNLIKTISFSILFCFNVFRISFFEIN